MERENRYLVIKRTDLDAALRMATPQAKASFGSVCNMAEIAREARGRGPLCCVVVEHDWPEYEPTWEAIEQRVFADSEYDVGN